MFAQKLYQRAIIFISCKKIYFFNLTIKYVINEIYLRQASMY